MTDHDIPQPGTPEYQKALKYEADRFALIDEARALAEYRGWTPPPRPMSLADQLAQELPEPRWVYKDLMLEGKGMVNAAKKAGKTTLLMNAVQALLLGEKFLGRFESDVDGDERIAYLNLELSGSLFTAEFAKMSLPDHATKRVEIYHAMEHGQINFRNDRMVDWLITWLTDSGIKHLFIDPLSSLYVASDWGKDPNDAFNKWWLILEDIHRKANLRMTMIAHHTGLSEDSANRGRGAAALGDKPDVNMSYRYQVGIGDNHTDKPKDKKRYLSAYGRGGVDVTDFEIIFNGDTNLLRPTGSGSTRKNAELEAQARRMYEEVSRIWNTNGNQEINKTEVFNALGWARTGKGADRDGQYYQYAISRGWVKRRDGSKNGTGKPWLHKPGSPPPKRMKLVV